MHNKSLLTYRLKTHPTGEILISWIVLSVFFAIQLFIYLFRIQKIKNIMDLLISVVIYKLRLHFNNFDISSWKFDVCIFVCFDCMYSNNERLRLIDNL